MEETLKLILEKLNGMESDIKELKLGQGELSQGQKELFQGQEELFKGQKQLFKGQEELFRGQSELFQGQKALEVSQVKLSDKLDAFEKQTMKRFNELDSKIASINDAVADLMEFRTYAESNLKKIK